MSKRKITHKQAARIKKIHDRHLEHSVLDATSQGLVVAHYGVFVDIELANKSIQRCNLRQNLGELVVGDQVVWHAEKNAANVIDAILPRKSLLCRPIAADKVKIIAANIDQVILTIAPQPYPAANLIDSYLVAIESLHLPAIILLNKCDLLTNDEESTKLRKRLILYRSIGYEVLETSALMATGMLNLQAHLKNHTSIIVGQSGVGKSSLTSRLMPEKSIRTDTFSSQGNRGMHTTTTSYLYHLPDGGDLIDSPGVRDFALWGMTSKQIVEGFREFKSWIALCKFRDCTHHHEPGCQLKQAVLEGKVSQERFESFQRIVAMLK